MKRVYLFLIILFSTQIISQSFFKTDGRDVLDTAGNKIILKGINLGHWLVPEGYMFKFKKTNAPRFINEAFSQLIGPYEAAEFWKEFQNHYVTYDDIKFIKSIGFNSIRVPFHYKLFNDETYLGNTESRGFELLDSLINWCKTENLYMVLDMHCAPGGQTGDNIDDSYGYPFLFESNEAQKQIILIWKNIAEYYSNEPIIIGYDLMNEPIAHYFNMELLNPKLEPLYKKIVTAIREVDRNHIIFLGGARWNTNFSVFGKPFDDNVIYTFHKYWMPPVKGEIQEYIDFRDKFNVPIYMGESGENEDDWINDFRSLLDEHEIGWHFWPYKKMNTTRGPVQFEEPENYDSIIEFAESDRSKYENIRNNSPDREISKKILYRYLENCKYQNCTPNDGYLKALGAK